MSEQVVIPPSVPPVTDEDRADARALLYRMLNDNPEALIEILDLLDLQVE